MVTMERFLKGVIGFSQGLFSVVKEVLRNPAADPRKTLLVGAILVVAILILVMLGLAVYSWLSVKKKRVVVVKPRRKISPRERWLGLGIFLAIIIGFLALGVSYTSRPSFCKGCHVEEREYNSWSQSSHKEVFCLACHQEPGISGWLSGKMSYLRWTLLFATHQYSNPIRASVTNLVCLRCHSKVTQKVVSRYGIRVRHKDFLEKGDRCTDCHNTIAHERVVPVAKYPTMEQCISCHNAKKASTECNLCHQSDTGEKIRKPKRSFVKITTPTPRQCRRCHSVERCIQCHGLELPHPPDWLAKEHPRRGFVNKPLCWKCHPSDFRSCNRCHMFPSLHEDEKEWVKLHGPAALKELIIDLANCSACHRENMCDACHVGKKEVELP